ncbi:MAG TPA: DNA-binding protein [Nitrospirota bacterium]|nr:DNA-binding protein [Nitrospirota bacterium]
MKKVLVIVFAACFGAASALSGAAYGASETSATKPAQMKISDETLVLSGKVVETMDSGGYTYVLLEKKGKKTWVAVPAMKVKVGEVVSFEPGVEMKNFSSKTLNRTFESIYFSNGPQGASHNSGQTAAMSMSMHGSSPAAAPVEKISVKKAEGNNACTVADVYAKKDALNEKTAVIRAKVVKVSAGIMGKNWFHLQDGTGDPSQGTHDLVVTSSETAAVGDVITATGTVYKDKDFGAGYKYAVIMEKANFKKQ